jgi:hypothetical protein
MAAERTRARDLLSIESRLNLVFGLMMSAFMACVLSGVMTWFNSPEGSFTLFRWARSFLLAWPIAFSLLLTVAPRIRRLAMRIVEYWNRNDINEA